MPSHIHQQTESLYQFLFLCLLTCTFLLAELFFSNLTPEVGGADEHMADKHICPTSQLLVTSKSTLTNSRRCLDITTNECDGGQDVRI